MKTYKILSSDNMVLTFTEDSGVYTLYSQHEDEQEIILQAKDDQNGITFMDEFSREFGYHHIDHLRLFLNLIGKIDYKLYESYIMLEPVGQI